MIEAVPWYGNGRGRRAGYGSSVAPAVHANHPLHLRSSKWLDAGCDLHDVVTQHSSFGVGYSRRRMPVLNPAGVVDAASLQEFMSEPAERLVAAAARVQGPVVVLGGSGKMGPDLVRTLRRADLAAGVRRDVTVASTFSDPASRAELEAGGIRCLTGDLADPAVLASLPEAAHVIYLLGFKFGSGTDWRRAFHLNGIVPYLVGERYPEASIVALSSTNPLPLVPWPEAAAGSDETADLAPEGVYGWSIVAREAAFATTALRHPRQRVSLIRLSYAQHFAYGVMRDLAAMVWEGEPISLQVPAANLVSQRDAIAYTLLSMEQSANPSRVVNVAGPALRVAELAERLGRVMGRRPRFAGAEGSCAVLADDRRCRDLFGEPRDPVTELEEPIARWVMAGGLSWNRPTHFGSTHRVY